MLIDTKKFLALVGALAVAGCTNASGDDGAGGSDTTTGQGGQTSTTAGQGGAGGDGTTGGTGGDGTTGGTGGATSGQGGAGGESSTTGGTGGGSCDDTVGEPEACSSECEGSDLCLLDGEVKAGLMVDVVECLNALDPEVCSGYVDAFEGCLLGTLATACPDDTADAFCEDSGALCGATAEECHAIADGLTDEGRAVVATCATDYCAEFGFTLKDCALDLLYY